MRKGQWSLDVTTVKKSIPPRLSECVVFLFDKNATFGRRLIELFVTKYLYIIVTVLVLDNAWYVGHGNYGIEFVFWKECVASVVFLLVSIVYLKLDSENNVLNFVAQLLFVIYYIPLNSSFSINNALWSFFVFSNLYFLLFLLVLHFIVIFKKRRETNSGRSEVTEIESLFYNRKIIVFCFVMCCIFIIHKITYNGLDFSLSIVGDNVYTNRATYQDYLYEISGTSFSYLLAIVRYLITYVTPFYILSALIRRSFVGVVTGVLCTLSMFSVSSEKSKLFMSLIALAVFVLYKGKLLNYFGRIVSIGVIGVLFVCTLEHVFFNNDAIYSLIIRREMYLPAWLDTLYYDFFRQNEKIILTQNVFLLQKFLNPVYDVSPLVLISDAYFQGMVPSPNTGMFAEAYMQLGWFGIMVYPMALACILVLSGKILKNYGDAVKVLFSIQLTLSLVNVPITRTDFVLSDCLFLTILWILPKLEYRQIHDGFLKLKSCRLNK